MPKKQPESSHAPPEFGAFVDLTRKLLAVPKKDLDKARQRYEDRKKRKPKK